jgi:hypothetical protein
METTAGETIELPDRQGADIYQGRFALKQLSFMPLTIVLPSNTLVMMM